MFISFLCMFRATMWPSSGEITVSMWHLVFVTLCGWLSGLHPANQTVIQVSHRYSYSSWWRALCRPKYVEKRNKHTKKNCAPSWLYLQDYSPVSWALGESNAISWDLREESAIWWALCHGRHIGVGQYLFIYLIFCSVYLMPVYKANERTT